MLEAEPPPSAHLPTHLPEPKHEAVAVQPWVQPAEDVQVPADDADADASAEAHAEAQPIRGNSTKTEEAHGPLATAAGEGATPKRFAALGVLLVAALLGGGGCSCGGAGSDGGNEPSVLPVDPEAGRHRQARGAAAGGKKAKRGTGSGRGRGRVDYVGLQHQ